jgi:endoglucanase
MTRHLRLLAAIAILSPLAACAAPPAPQAGDASPIRLNQVGYLPDANKLGVLGLAPGGTAGDGFRIENDKGKVVLQGQLQPARDWAPAGQLARIADFSALRKPGRYRLLVDGVAASDPFVVGRQAYLPVVGAALKAYYYNRASTALPAAYAGIYARAAGHPDTQVLVHASAASPQRPAGSTISAPKGWYDAGDYNKYIVNAGISTYTLLSAYEHYPALFRDLRVGIPDEANGAPDILQEAWWNLQWMLAMQDPADGGVYHKLTNQQFDGVVMPAQAQQPRYVVMKGTAATLDFAAVMAAASRIYAPFEAQYPGQSARMLAAARAAWAWAQQHPDVVYKQPDDIHTGGYDDAELDDEFAWAAAELYVATGEGAFYQASVARNVPASVPSWGSVGGLAWMTLAQHRDRLGPDADRARITREINGLATQLATQWQQSPWRVASEAGDFHWGSNAVLLNQAMMLLQGYRLSHRREDLDAAQSQLDYVLGRNPLGRSFVTGIGLRPPLHIHHRLSEADGIDAPVPGLLAGGANAGQQDAKDCKVAYPSSLPALAYLDDTCSYASNEVAINWNAPLVYVSAALQALGGR